MSIPAIGQILRDMGVLIDRDIDEILDEQTRSGQRFGCIAMRWGLATPTQVWEAWARQLTMEMAEADLDELGTDSTAMLRVSPDLVRQYHIWPLRLWGDNLVVATAPDCPEETLQKLAAHLGLTIHQSVAPPDQIERLIRKINAEATAVAVPAMDAARVAAS
ncbi:MAG: hypothetical protein JXA69_11260 [Phycisphaerae bacterium]|nr:hypothetical protein [Phycisphaerae bacterium]